MPKLERLDVSGPFPNCLVENSHLAAAVAAQHDMPGVGHYAVTAALALTPTAARASAIAAGRQGTILYPQLRQVKVSVVAVAAPLIMRLFVPETQNFTRALTHLSLRVRQYDFSDYAPALPPITSSPAMQRHLRCLSVDIQISSYVLLPSDELRGLGKLSALTELALLTSHNSSPPKFETGFKPIETTPDFNDADLAELLTQFSSRLLSLELDVYFPGVLPGKLFLIIGQCCSVLETLRCPETIWLEPIPEEAAESINNRYAASPDVQRLYHLSTNEETPTSPALFPI
jgi:hypothetical protein